MYARCSDQGALAGLRPRQREARRRLAAYDGPFAGLPPLIRENLALSVRHMRLTLWPALAASLPVLLFMPWLSNHFGAHPPPPGGKVYVRVESFTPYGLHWRPAQMAEPEPGTGRWTLTWPGGQRRLELLDDDKTVLDLPGEQPGAVLHKRHWWNTLIGNPAGYLDPDSVLEEVSLAFPQHQVLPVGPPWLRGWLPVFLLCLLGFSLLFRHRMRLR